MFKVKILLIIGDTGSFGNAVAFHPPVASQFSTDGGWATDDQWASDPSLPQTLPLDRTRW